MSPEAVSPEEAAAAHARPLDQFLRGPELREAARIMTICNACRYCEGLCAVFPAMEMRRDFAAGDLRHLANLCHACGACYHDCQYAPPHEFGVNVPRTLEALRPVAYADHAQELALHRAQTASESDAQRHAITDWIYWQHLGVLMNDAVASEAPA